MNRIGRPKPEDRIKKTKVRWSIVCFLFSVICLLVLAGCEEFTKEEDFLDVKVKPEQTRAVDTLKLTAKADANDGIDINTPAEKEITLSIEQCRAMTLKNNLDLKVQLIEPTIAAKQVSAEEAKF
jgi:hypothetical protein